MFEFVFDRGNLKCLFHPKMLVLRLVLDGSATSLRRYIFFII